MTDTRPYAITIRSNPGIYGEDAQGNPWTTFTLFSQTIACSVCGKQIDGGYVRGKHGEEDLFLCCSHVQITTQETHP